MDAAAKHAPSSRRSLPGHVLTQPAIEWLFALFVSDMVVGLDNSAVDALRLAGF